jgi:phage FluMu protein Com
MLSGLDAVPAGPRFTCEEATTMPIEFRCNQCGKLLRTADDTAGQQAKCPSCGAIQVIPARSSGDEEGTYRLSEPPPSASSPFAAAAQPPPTPFGADNPYASPMAPTAQYDQPFEDYPRSGPPWERDGASVASFVATAQEALRSAAPFLSEMRREGGFALPLAYVFLGGMIGTVANVVYQAIWNALLRNLGPGNPPFQLFEVLMPLCIGPLIIIAYPIVWAAVTHLMLMLFGGARFPYQTTYRVTAYSVGVGSLLVLVPICGGLASFIATLVFLCIGIANAHETSNGKAVAAVLLPFLACCGLAVAVFVVDRLAAGM